ncbi:MAG TPA: SCP2 sterol-binding domain-containing protein [Myxococcota bacterium]|jgi:hypothetical protein
MADLSPASFFDEIAPRLLAAQRELCAKLGGVYAVKLGAAGTWTLDFATAAVTHGITKRPVLTLEMGAADFALMFGGKLDVAAALKSGRVKLHGDARKIAHLATVLGAGL